MLDGLIYFAKYTSKKRYERIKIMTTIINNDRELEVFLGEFEYVAGKNETDDIRKRMGNDAGYFEKNILIIRISKTEQECSDVILRNVVCTKSAIQANLEYIKDTVKTKLMQDYIAISIIRMKRSKLKGRSLFIKERGCEGTP